MYKERLVFDREGLPMIRGFNKTEYHFRYFGFWDYFYYMPELFISMVINIFS